MANTIEIERRYLAKYLPEGIENCESIDVVDIYIPKSATHPKLRIRKRGQKFEITKKVPVAEGDTSKQLEQTIPLTEEEYTELSNLAGKRVQKRRYIFPYEGRTAEIGVFGGALEGLVIVDFEFEKQEEMDAFAMPEFCLADVTNEHFLAGGLLCGKSYSDIEGELLRFNYSKIMQH